MPTSKYELLRMFLKADPRYTVVDQIFFFWPRWEHFAGLSLFDEVVFEAHDGS